MIKWTGFSILLLGVLLAGGGFVYALTRVAAPAHVVAAHQVTIDYKIVAPDDPSAATGPDGKTHDTFRAVSMPAIHVGDVVNIRVTNYDDMPHGMVFDTLQISKMLAPAKSDSQPGVTTFSFTATKAGTFRWYCPIPCDTDNGMWAMSASSSGPGQDGFMAGSITVA